MQSYKTKFSPTTIQLIRATEKTSALWIFTISNQTKIIQKFILQWNVASWFGVFLLFDPKSTQLTCCNILPLDSFKRALNPHQIGMVAGELPLFEQVLRVKLRNSPVENSHPLNFPSTSNTTIQTCRVNAKRYIFLVSKKNIKLSLWQEYSVWKIMYYESFGNLPKNVPRDKSKNEKSRQCFSLCSLHFTWKRPHHAYIFCTFIIRLWFNSNS